MGIGFDHESLYRLQGCKLCFSVMSPYDVMDGCKTDTRDLIRIKLISMTLPVNGVIREYGSRRLILSCVGLN